MITAAWALLARTGRWLWKHPKTVGIALAAAAVWLWRARITARLARARAERDRAELQRDVAEGRADVAEATVAVTVEVAAAREAGAAVAQEVRDVPVTEDPAADRAALYDRVREVARREGAAPGDRAAAAVRDNAAARARPAGDAGHGSRDALPGRAPRVGVGDVARLPAADAVTDTIRPGDVVVYGWHEVAGVRRPGHCGIVVEVPGYAGPVPDHVVRAEGYLGRGVYELGAGGTHLGDGTPFDADGHADCSGFVLELLGLDRRARDGHPALNTSAMIADALGRRRLFEPVSGPVDWRAIRVVHCAASHPERGAVRETGGTPWLKFGIAIRRRG